MSDTMLFGVLRMPYELAMSSELSRVQFHCLAQEAADTIESQAAEIAKLTAETAAIRELMNVYNLGGWTDALGPMQRASKAEAERDALATNLLAAERTLRDRAHPAREPRDPPECLRTLGFWPDCGCGECYAIHCLDNAMAERDALRAALLDTARRVEALKRPCGMDPESAQAIRNGEYMSIALTARAIERLILGEQG